MIYYRMLHVRLHWNLLRSEIYWVFHLILIHTFGLYCTTILYSTSHNLLYIKPNKGLSILGFWTTTRIPSRLGFNDGYVPKEDILGTPSDRCTLKIQPLRSTITRQDASGDLNENKLTVGNQNRKNSFCHWVKYL